MKTRTKLGLAGLALLTFVSCNPSQSQLWKKDRDTGFGGLYRHIVVKNGITDTITYEKTGRCFIDDSSTVNFLKILWIDKNLKDNVYLGDNYSVVAEEMEE